MPEPRAIFSFVIFYLFLNDHLRKAISGSTGPIFTKFSPYGRYLTVHYRSDFFDGSRDVAIAMAISFRVKVNEFGLLTYIHRFDIPKWSARISQFRFERFIVDDLASSCKNVV